MQFNKVFRSMVTGWLLATLALPGTPLLAADGRGRGPNIVPGGAAATVLANSLLALDVQEATQTTVLTVRGNLAPTFTTFKLDKPARLFVDVAGASVGTLGEPKYVNNGVIRSVEAVPFVRGNATYARIVVTFEQDALYHVRSEGNSVVIVVDGSDRKLNQTQTAQIAAAEDAAKTAAAREHKLLEELRSSRSREEAAQGEQQKMQAELARLQKSGAEAGGQVQANAAQLAQAQAAADLANQRLKDEQVAGAKLREDLNKERASLAAVVAQRQSEEARVELLRQKIADMQQDTQKKDTAQLGKDHAQLGVLQAELEKARKQAESLREEVRKASESRRTAQAEEVEHLKKVLADKDRELKATAERSDAAAQAQAQQLKAELAAARANLSQTQTALDRASKADVERESAERKWRQAEDRAMASEKALAEKNAELAQSKQQVADLAEQKQKAAERAEQVAKLLVEREQEIGAVRTALKEREAALSAELAAAKEREAQAAKSGRKQEALQAAQERAELEKRQKSLANELTARETELKAARLQAEKNETARAAAERQADKLRAVLAERETALQVLQNTKDASSKQELAAAEQKVRAARAQLLEQAAQRDVQLQTLQSQLTGQIAQVRGELVQAQAAAKASAAEIERMKEESAQVQAAALAREDELKRQNAQSKQQVADLAVQKQKAAAQAEQVAKLLQEREQEIGAVRSALKEREAALAAELAAAKAREAEAAKNGRQEEAQQAAQERTELEKRQKSLANELTTRETELKAARAEADKNATARAAAEKQAEQLRGVLAEREKALQTLQNANDAASKQELAAAQSKVAAARAELQQQAAQRDAQLQSLQTQLTGQIAQVKGELSAAQAAAKASAAELAVAKKESAQASAAAQAREAELKRQNAQTTKQAEELKKQKVAEQAAAAAREEELKRQNVQTTKQAEELKKQKVAEQAAAAAREEELKRQNAEAASKAAHAAQLLTQREQELAGLREALKARESKLAQQAAAATAAEKLAEKAGKKADIERAKADQARVAVAQAALHKELDAQHASLEQARSEAKHNADARAKAEAEAQRLNRVVAEREKELAAAKTRATTAGELHKAQRAVDEARLRLQQQKVDESKREAAMTAQFDNKLAQMRNDLQSGHEREMARVKQERKDQEKIAQERASRVEGLLKDRESELKRLQDEMRVREMTLAAQLEQARAKESEAQTRGQASEAQKAAGERKQIEAQMQGLQGDLQAREKALQAATQEVQSQAHARANAEQEVEKLHKALQEREAALSQARDSASASANGDVAKAQAQVELARKQHEQAMAARDADMKKLEQDVEARIAQVKTQLADEHRKREAALSAQYQEKLAAAEADAHATSRAASEQTEHMAALLGQREKELKQLKAAQAAHVEELNAQLAQARKREQVASNSGKKQEAAAAAKELKALQKDAEAAKKAVAQREAAIEAAKQQAESASKARLAAERTASSLNAALEQRAAELRKLKNDSQSSSARVMAAEKAVAEAQNKLDAQEKAQQAQTAKLQEQLEKEIVAVRRQMQLDSDAREKALTDKHAAREKELESALAAEQNRRLKAEQVAAGKSSAKGMDDYLQKQQARIALLESRAERERQSRNDTDKMAEKESKRAQELQAKLEAVQAEKTKQLRELELARQKAEAQELAQADKTAAQNATKDNEQLRREAQAERQRTRLKRGDEQPKDPAGKEPAIIKDIAITAEGQHRGRIELPLQGQLKDAQVEVLSREDNRAVLRIVGAQLPDRLQRAFDTRALQGPMERVTAFAPEGTKDELRVVVDLLQPSSDRISMQNGRLVWQFERAEANGGTKVDNNVAKAGVSSAVKSGTSVVKSGGDVLAAAPQPLMAAAGDDGGGTADRGSMSNADNAGVASDPIKAPWRKARRYTGKRINLTIKDADIQHVLTFLAKEGKVNIIAGPEVAGKVTFHLENIPWDLALDVILRAREMDYVRQSGVIRVSTREALKKEFDSEVERRQKMEDVKQLVVRIIPVNYGDSALIVNQVKEVLSKKGTVTAEPRTNAVVVKDTEEHVAAVEEMIRKLDAQTPQVLIEARIVEASSSFTKDMGVQWGGNFAQSAVFGNETGLIFPSVVGVAGGADGASPDIKGVAITTPNYAVNLPAAVGSGAGGAIGLTLGSIGGAGNLNLRLSAAEQEGTVKIVSSPKVLTLDNQQATIRQGISIPISVVSAQGVQTRFFNADLQLQAKPHVTQDGNVQMSVRISKNEPDFSARAADGNPTIATREASTDLLLADGETTVIGGIYTRSTSTSVKKVPFFADIPLIGALFRSHTEQDKRTELLIFITPRIVNRAAAITVGK